MDAMNHLQHPTTSLRLFWRFVGRVLRDFKRNQGLLLSGAIAYYTLLSIVPLSILAIVVFSHFFEEQLLYQIMTTYLDMVMPGYAVTLTEQVRGFLAHRNVVGIVGFVVMLFFSSIAFSMLENAMSLIFHHRFKTPRRHFLISAIIPYLYIFLIGLGIFTVTIAAGIIGNLEYDAVNIFGWNLHGVTGVFLALLGILGEFIILSSVYLVMPVARVSLRYALIGGMTATILWEITRRALVWYYGVLSMVNLVYGSIAIAVVALLSVEVAAIIVLLGAQVIAELMARDEAKGKVELPGGGFGETG